MPDYGKMTREELIRLLEALRPSIKEREQKNAEDILQELKVNQVELEAQNRQLREAQQELEEARDRFSNLYDSAPNGYLTLGEKNCILEINLTCANILGVERSHIIGKPFIQFVEKASLRSYTEHLRRAKCSSERISTELKLVPKDRPTLEMEIQSAIYEDPIHRKKVLQSAILDITERKKTEAELKRLYYRLMEAQAKIKALSGMLPICAACKKIRNDRGLWDSVEKYISEHSDAEFTHSMCPECVEKYYPDLHDKIKK